tara:strand:+ start:284 stop:457 length:174 start_codon:yes stop_codon:yes gene_type:complete
MVATRRVYEGIASVLKELYDEHILISPRAAVDMAVVFARDNPRFDYYTFMAAIGIEE